MLHGHQRAVDLRNRAVVRGCGEVGHRSGRGADLAVMAHHVGDGAGQILFLGEHGQVRIVNGHDRRGVVVDILFALFGADVGECFVLQ